MPLESQYKELIKVCEFFYRTLLAQCSDDTDIDSIIRIRVSWTLYLTSQLPL